MVKSEHSGVEWVVQRHRAEADSKTVKMVSSVVGRVERMDKSLG